jgi:hypothetical protein
VLRKSSCFSSIAVLVVEYVIKYKILLITNSNIDRNRFKNYNNIFKP